MKKKVAFYTLGCKVNFCDTESLQALFENAGFRVVPFSEQANVYVINTCTVTHQSDHKSRKAIRQARRRAPCSIVVVTGCYAQRYPDELSKMSEVNLFTGTCERKEMPDIVNTLLHKSRLELVKQYDKNNTFEQLPLPANRKRTRGFLKIQDGCNQQCAYCVIPSVRGPLRSLLPQEVISRVTGLVESGCREIVLTGIHLGLYGHDLCNHSLASLLKEVHAIPGLLRLRLSSLEPTDVTSELVEQILSSKTICPHLHIPLQSGDSEILKRMNRPYAPVEFLYLAKWLKQQIKHLSLSTDIIVGFPGESDEHHERSMKLVREIGFSKLHVFKFSPRPGTAAYTYPEQVPNEVKDKRSKDMIELGNKMHDEYKKMFIGSEQTVLVEKVEKYSAIEGFTPHYLRVKTAIDNRGNHYRGKEIQVCIDSARNNLLLASIVKRK